MICLLLLFSGDVCLVNELQSGVCRLVTSCPSIYNDKDKHKKRPKICGFQGTQPIVCCADVLPLEVSTISPASKPVPTTLLSPVSRPNPVPSRTDSQQINCEFF